MLSQVKSVLPIARPGTSSGFCHGEVQRMRRRKLRGNARKPRRMCRTVAPMRRTRLSITTPIAKPTENGVLKRENITIAPACVTGLVPPTAPTIAAVISLAPLIAMPIATATATASAPPPATAAPTAPAKAPAIATAPAAADAPATVAANAPAPTIPTIMTPAPAVEIQPMTKPRQKADVFSRSIRKCRARKYAVMPASRAATSWSTEARQRSFG